MILQFSAVIAKSLPPKELQIKNRVAKLEDVRQGEIIVETYKLVNIVIKQLR